MQENNNFETIIDSWRRMSEQQIDITILESMSGDSPSQQIFKKKEEETNFFVLERPKGPLATAASAGAVVLATDISQVTTKPTNPVNDPNKEENQDNAGVTFMAKNENDKCLQTNPESIDKDECNREENQGCAGDAKNANGDKLIQGNTDSMTSKSQESKLGGNEMGDKVDSVYLRPPPPQKVRSTVSSTEEDNCGVKCLYYTLLCCDCVLM